MKDLFLKKMNAELAPPTPELLTAQEEENKNNKVHYQIPQIKNNNSQNIELDNGKPLFLVGPNGSGKSSLMYYLYINSKNSKKRISAHRQNWFTKQGIDLSKSSVEQHENWIRNSDSTPESRWKDEYAARRPDISIFELIETENAYARNFLKLSKEKDFHEVEKALLQQTNLEKINDLLLASNFQVELSINESGNLMARRFDNPTSYSVSKLSDGERNALLIASDILQAAPDTVILVDEPERHLHRSITTPFLTQLIQLRQDCKFIISTHEVQIPNEIKESRVLVVRDCDYKNEFSPKWETEYIENPELIDDSIITEILGSRKNVLFIEGDIRSLDLPLYSIIFPNVSIIPKKSCRDVIHIVNGINDARNLHHTQAFGLIDNDKRPQEKIDELALKKIHALKAYSVESIYYNQYILEILAKKQADVIGFDAQEKLKTAKLKFFKSINSSKEDLCIRSIEKTLQNEVDSKNIKRKDIKTTDILSIEINVKEKLDQEVILLDKKISAEDYQYIVNNYPVRSSTALDACTKEIGFQGKEQYEAAVIKLLKDSAEARQIVQQMLSPLYEAMTQD